MNKWVRKIRLEIAFRLSMLAIQISPGNDTIDEQKGQVK